MDDEHGGGRIGGAAEELVLRTVAAHAESLLRTARRHSLCADDAHDAYQRALEIFMRRAERLDSARAAPWLHVVVKREAQAVRRQRARTVSAYDVDLDEHESEALKSVEDQALTFAMLTRSAEALRRLKAQELRALWLKAQGHSYSDIGAITGWSYTKVNRCIAEGRRAFLERYAGIESGEECLRWRAVVSAMADGEAAGEDVEQVRPHLRNCPGCRATLNALRERRDPLPALLPLPLLAADAGADDHVASLLLRLYEGLAGGVHERAAHAATKVQVAIEAATSGKVAALAASAAAAAGGGIATVERVVERATGDRPAQVRSAEAAPAQVASTPAEPPPAVAPPPPPPSPPPPAPPPAAAGRDAAAPGEARPAAGEAAVSKPEFDLEPQAPPPAPDDAGGGDVATAAPAPPAARAAARERSSPAAASGGEFGF